MQAMPIQPIPNQHLDPHAIQAQKALFEQVLIQEIQLEIDYSSNVVQGRAERRKYFKEKVLNLVVYLTKGILGVVGGAVPAAALGTGVAAGVIEAGMIPVSAIIGRRGVAEVERLSNLIYQLATGDIEGVKDFKAEIRHFAKAASLRYEHIIATRLTEDPAGSVIPLARIGAKRVVEFVKRLGDQISSNKTVDQIVNDFFIQHTDRSFTNMLLDGLMQGRTGRREEDFTNNRLIGRGIYAKARLTAEGIFGRSAMRNLVVGVGNNDETAWHIFYRDKSRHKEQGIEKWHDWGRTAFNKKGPFLRKLRSPAYGPKYGAMFVQPAVMDKCDYRSQFAYGREYQTHDLDAAYYPSVYIATIEDIEEYQRANQGNNNNNNTFFAFIQNKVRAVFNDKREIKEVWVSNVDFSRKTLENGDYTGINFSGCLFNNTRIVNCCFNRADMTFIEGEELECVNVQFVKTDFSGANLTNVKFKEVLYVGAIWRNALIDGIKDNSNARIHDEINAVAAQQLLSDENLRKEIKELFAENAKLKSESLSHIARIEQVFQSKVAQLQEVDQLIRQQIKLLRDQMVLQIQFRNNQEDFKVYCEAEILRLRKRDGELQADIDKLSVSADAQAKLLQQYKMEQDSSVVLLDKNLKDISKYLVSTKNEFNERISKTEALLEKISLDVDQMKADIVTIKSELVRLQDLQVGIVKAIGLKNCSICEDGFTLIGTIEAIGFQATIGTLDADTHKRILEYMQRAAQDRPNVLAVAFENVTFGPGVKTVTAPPTRAIGTNLVIGQSNVKTVASVRFPASHPKVSTVIDRAKHCMDLIYPTDSSDEFIITTRRLKEALFEDFKKTGVTSDDISELSKFSDQIEAFLGESPTRGPK